MIKVLMVSLDRGLLEQAEAEMGDVVYRHREYGRYVERLDIIVFSRRGCSQNKISENVNVFPTNSKSKFNYLLDAYRIGQGFFRKNYYQLIITQAPFISGLVGYFLAKKFRVKLLIHFHGDYIQNKEWLKEKWYNFLMVPVSKFLAKKADGLRVMSQGIKDKLIMSGVPAPKIRVISTPVSLPKSGSRPSQKAAQLKSQYSDKKIILFIGRLEKEKNLPLLLKALKRVKEKYQKFILLVIGRGSLKEAWQEIVKKMTLENEVVFLGQIIHEDLADYYQASEFLVSSSASESFGKVLVEAMMSDLPVIATATTGSKEIVVDGQNGFLVPIGNSQIMAQKILYLLNNPIRAKEMGATGKKMVKERFNPQENIQKIINFWYDLAQ